MSEPPITRRAAHGSRRQSRPTRVVIHDEEFPVEDTSAESIAGYFTQPTSGGSAQYVTDANSEQHCVPDDVAAWHAPPNDGSIGIEGDGYARFSRAEWLTDGSRRTMARTAARTAELCVRFGIPARRIGVAELRAGAHGICGHVDVSQAWHQSDHNDPGAHYPWDLFLPLVQRGVALLGDVSGFQRANGLTVDGDAGIKTVLKLGDVLHGAAVATPPTQTVPPAKPAAGRYSGFPLVKLGSSDHGAGSSLCDAHKPVTSVQNALNILLKHEARTDPFHLGADGEFGAKTEAAVKTLQRDVFDRDGKHPADVDGAVGAHTYLLLGFLLTAMGR